MEINNLLQTKFFVPSVRNNLVTRDRLVKHVEQNIHRKLTLICAPAGFGKTTLLAEWLKQTNSKYTWLSLDEQDNELSRFWLYLITAIAKITPPHLEITTTHLQNQELNFESLLTPLINQLANLTEDIVIILDDYHLIDDREIHQSFDFFLNHIPPQLHFVIATRSDPPLPLAKLRARGELTELRIQELRFNSEEIQIFTNEIMEINLSALQISTLKTKIEGWIAGLQMAGLSLQQCGDTTAWIDSLQGNNRYTWDYLTEEVLQQQPEEIKAF